MSEGAEPPIERTVKPRRPYQTRLPIIAIGPAEMYAEKTQEILPRAVLADLIAEHPPALVTCQHPEQLLIELEPLFADDPNWQFKVTPLQRERVHLDGERTVYTETLVNFFGWQRASGRQRTRYFYPVCPAQFCRRYIHEIYPDDLPRHEALYRWGCAIRNFCRRFDLKPSPTGGGLAAQLLRHPRFYPLPRRKVPTATNEKARPHLPGNYYELNAKRSQAARLKGLEYEPIRAAWYIDQFDAHHSAAIAVGVPHSDNLRGRGHFRTLDPHPWVRPGSRSWDEINAHRGLLHCTIEVPSKLAEVPFLPPQLREVGTHAIYCYTSEIAEYLQLGVRVHWISAAWTAPEADPAIRKYATWAREEIKANPDEAKWLKPTLLAAYGILAARPRKLEFIYRRATKGEPHELVLGPELIHCLKLQTKKQIQSPIANVIQRGMIEAETRNRSLRLARELHGYGFTVVAIYADAVIVKDTGRPLPLCTSEHPWRVKQRLTDLHFLNETAFKSREKSRLPGVARKHRTTGGSENGHVRRPSAVH